jgi:crotonobetainyl-CoA:carnitine CoA-transferase CaiB-like acyl-CoA transferase
VLEPLLNEAIGKKTTEEWLREFDAIGMPCGPLNDVPQAVEHRQVKAREMIREVEHPAGFSLKVTDTPLKLSRTPGGIQGPPPTIGADTDDALKRLLGLSQEEISALRERKVIFGPMPSPVPRILAHEKRDS